MQNDDKYIICRKSKYRTEQDAIFALNKIKESSNRKCIPIRTYLCGKCHCWHLTSKPNAIELAAENRLLKEQVAELTRKLEKYQDKSKK